jgi:hypothetical protein
MSTSITTVNVNVLCIPGVFANIGEERIRRAFADLDIGEITRVDIVIPKFDAAANAAPSNKKFNRVFIHIVWNNSRQAASAQEKLSQGKEIKIVYDQPWFWKVSAYKKTEKAKAPEPKHKKATIEFDEEECACGHLAPKNGNCMECIWILEQEEHRKHYKPPLPTSEKPKKEANQEAAAKLLASVEIKEEKLEPWKLSTVSQSGDVQFPHFKRPRGKIIIAPAL